MRLNRKRRNGVGVGTGSSEVPPPRSPQPLPRAGDPLVLSDGRIIQPESVAKLGQVDPEIIDCEPKDFRPIATRNLEDFPADPKMVVACGAVLSLTMLGIGDREIMDTLRFSDEQLNKARDHEVYADMFNAFYKELINANSTSLQARIAAYAHGALSNVAYIAATAKRDDVRLTANRDILDRAGTKVSDQVERDKTKTTSLRISILKGDTTVEVNNIDIGG
jgi:hypothetical protein